MEASQIKHVMFYVPLKPAGSLLLAELADGRYRILRDDQPVAGCTWEAHQVVKAVSKFEEMKALLTTSKA